MSPAAPPGPAPKGFAMSGRRALVEVAVVLLVLAGLVLAARGCAGWVAGAAVSMLPASVDAQVGRALAEPQRAAYRARGEPSPADVARVEAIFTELRGALRPEERDALGAARVTVVVDATPNAFALPGGEVFVLTGLLARADDDQLRGVLAHELGHAVLRHGMRAVARDAAFGLVVAIVLGDLDETASLLVATAGRLDALRYTRGMESDSDAFAVELLRRTGRSPEGLARFLESLEGAPVPEILSTHPDSAARARALREGKRR